MRLLHVLSSVAAVQGGPARSTLAAIRAVHAADPSVTGTLLSTDYRLEDWWGAELRAKLPDGVGLELARFYGRHTAAFSPGLVGWVRRHARDYDVVVVRTQLHPISTAAAWAARAAGVPYVLTPHGTLSDYTFDHRNALPKRLYYRLLDAPLARDAAAVQCTTEAEARQVRARTPGAEVEVVPHAFEPGAAPSPAPVPGRVGFLSRLDPMKGFDVLLPAMARVRAARPDAHLVVAGTGAPDYERHLRDEVERLGLTEAVEFVGFVDGEAKRSFFAQSAAFALPSFRENFGIAVVEAMSAGVPVVVSEGVDLGHEIEAAGAGTVAARTPGAVADALLAFLERPDHALEVGRRGRAYVEGAFAPAAVGRRLLDLYRRAAGAPAP